MTAEQQKRKTGISAEADEAGFVVIDADRSLQLLTPAEVEVFHAHLAKAYRKARKIRRERPQPIAHPALESGVMFGC